MVCGLGLGGHFRSVCCWRSITLRNPLLLETGGVYAGDRFYHRRACPLVSGVLRSISGNYLMDWAFHALASLG